MPDLTIEIRVEKSCRALNIQHYSFYGNGTGCGRELVDQMPPKTTKSKKPSDQNPPFTCFTRIKPG